MKLDKISLRMRLTIFVTVLLTFSCIALTGIISFSAGKMATQIEAASLITPANPAPIPNEIIPAMPTEEPITFTPPIDDVKRNFHAESLLAMTLVILTGGFFTWYTAGKTLSPVKDLSVQIKNITVHNLRKEIEVPLTNDEIADLTLSFNEMTERISEAFESQKRFSASAAHELRTPLTVMQTKVDVFRKKAEHSLDEYENLINVINLQTQRLSSLISDLLKMTCIEEEQLNEEVDLSLEIDEIIDELKGVAEKKDIVLSFSGTAPIIYGNSLLIQRAIYNLIENAIKYNVVNGKVEVNLSSANDKVIVSVADTGIGIPDDMKSNIYEPFFRVDKSRSRALGGAGLGLSMVKTILEHNNAIILIKDNIPNGTVFEIVFSRK